MINYALILNNKIPEKLLAFSSSVSIYLSFPELKELLYLT